MKCNKAFLDDFLDEVGIAAAVITVVNANGRHTRGLGLFDRHFSAAIGGDIADIVAAVDQRRYRRLARNAYRLARLFGLDVGGNRQHARQAGKTVAAQRVVNQLVDGDAGVFTAVAHRLQRALAQFGRLFSGDAQEIGMVGVQQGAGGGRVRHDQSLSVK